jgi:hypothetical protein
MLFFLPETAFPREAAASLDGFTPKQTPFLNVMPIAGLKHPKLWATTASCIRLFTYPAIAVPIICYCWSWYWVRDLLPHFIGLHLILATPVYFMPYHNDPGRLP